MDRSIVRPVLEAIVELGAAREQLADYYRIIDRFCAKWLGKPRSAMSLEDEETVYLTHELLREYLRFEGNNKRVALWLLTINRCCRNYSADLSRTRAEFARIVRGTDLAFDHTLLSPILQRVRFYEERHSSAAAEGLGGRDSLGSFYQWVGIYCTYVYPRLREDPRSKDRSMVSTLGFLISEFISLKANVSRMAALVLAIKEACALARPAASADSAADAAGDTVAPGTETRYVEQILDRLRAESSAEPSVKPLAEPSVKPLAEQASQKAKGGPKGTRSAASKEDRAAKTGSAAETSGDGLGARILAVARELARTETGLERMMEKIDQWITRELGREGDRLKSSAAALFQRETPKSREAVRRMAVGLQRNPRAMRAEVQLRIRTAKGSAKALLARLYVLALLESLV